jgi:hypothetical protein
MSASGTSSRFAAALRFGRKRSIADMARFSSRTETVAIDPQETFASSSYRAAGHSLSGEIHR